MNTLAKFSMVAVFGVLGATSIAAPAGAASVFGVTVPDLAALTTEISTLIANEVKSQLQSAIKAPRQRRDRRSPSVTVVEGAAVIVEASRLPPLDGQEVGEIRTAQIQRSVRF